MININTTSTINHVKYDISKIFITNHYIEKNKYIVFFTINIINNDIKPLKFFYSNLKVMDNSSGMYLSILPQTSLIASIAPLPIVINNGNSLRLDLFFVVNKLNGKYDFTWTSI